MATPNGSLFNSALFGGDSAAAPTGFIAVSRLIYTGYRLAGVLPTAGRGYSPSQLSDGLDALNSMVDGAKAERLFVIAILRTLFDLVANQATYQIGTYGTPDWALERPERIEGAGFIFTNSTPNTETRIEILTDQKWRALSPKDSTSGVVSKIYYQKFTPAPNGTIYVWPICTVAYQIALYTWQTVNQFATPEELVVVPPAYRRYLEYNLAIELAARFPLHAKLSQLTIEIARESKRVVKAMNAPELLSQCESGACGTSGDGGHYNILSNRRV
jgi:hypothetical protein